MRNLLAFLAAAILTFAAVGWYLNWYQVRAVPAPSGKHSFTLDVDAKKIGADWQKTEKVGSEIGSELLEKAKAARADAEPNGTEQKDESKKDEVTPPGK
jgi:hypothetical protein